MNEIIEIRHLPKSDFEPLKAAMLLVYPRMASYWRQEQVECLVDIFPEDHFVVTVNDEVVAGALALIVNHDDFEGEHIFKQVTGDYTFSTHCADGDTLYDI